MSVQLGFGGDAGGKGLTSLFRSLILLLFVGGLAAFFLINPAKWLPSQIPELLLVRVNATRDLQAWLEDARRRFLANSPRVAGRPLSLSIDYEEDTVASKGIVERLQQGATPASAFAQRGRATPWLGARFALDAG
jgi:hypothetical protein